jgi:acyl-CoA thioesterase-1
MLRPVARVLVTLVLAFHVLLAGVPPASVHGAGEPVIVALGDSLTAGWGVAPEEAYPALLQARLRREGLAFRVVNAGVSGDTSAGGLARLEWTLRTGPAIVIVALGANDGLRGQPPSATRANLTAILDRLRARKVRTLLAGMRMPPNYGADYTREYAQVFADLGARADAFMPFLLDGVAGVPGLNQPDGIHPNAEGHRVIAERLWRHLRPLLAGDRATAPAAQPPRGPPQVEGCRAPDRGSRCSLRPVSAPLTT